MPVYRMRLWTGETQKTGSSLLSVFPLFPACEYTMHSCVSPPAYQEHIGLISLPLALGSVYLPDSKKVVWGTDKALAVWGEQAEEAPFMECAQAVGSTLPGSPE